MGMDSSRDETVDWSSTSVVKGHIDPPYYGLWSDALQRWFAVNGVVFATPSRAVAEAQQHSDHQRSMSPSYEVRAF
jgi:hypothetical protein